MLRQYLKGVLTPFTFFTVPLSLPDADLEMKTMQKPFQILDVEVSSIVVPTYGDKRREDLLVSALLQPLELWKERVTFHWGRT